MTPPFPDKKYSVIYADPPWKCDNNRFTNGELITPYPTMTFDEINALPVNEIADENCLLFLWVVSRYLKQGIKAGESWGFEYSTIGFVWDKQRTLVGGYTLGQCEICLTFRKGSVPEPRGKRNIRQFLSVKRGRHSVKPYEVRQRITEMFPHHEKIELFARERFDGWDAWGNEV